MDKVEMTERFEAIEQRLRNLERNSHPPIDLEPAILEILRDISTGEAAKAAA